MFIGIVLKKILIVFHPVEQCMKIGKIYLTKRFAILSRQLGYQSKELLAHQI